MLILATVSVQVLTGDNGLLTKTETAVQSNKDSQEEEKVKLAVVAAQLAGQGNITTDNLNEELKFQFNNNKEVIEYKEFYIYKTDKSYKIYKNGKVEVEVQVQDKIVLPIDYQQVEYIESTGLQYIDTGVIPSSNQRYNVKFSIKEYGNQVIFGSRTDGNYQTSTNQVYLNANPNVSNKWMMFLGTTINYLEEVVLNTDYEFNYAINDLESNFDNSAKNSIFIFNLNAGGTPHSDIVTIMRLYHMEIYESNVLVKKFIPCKRKSDNKPGLLDLVDNEFYTNKNTSGNDFTLGPDV